MGVPPWRATPASPPKVAKPGRSAQRLPSDQRAVAPKPPSKPTAAPAPSEPKRKWEIPRFWRRSEGVPPVPPKQPEGPLIAPKVTPPQPPEDRSARVHRWWRTTRPEEPTSARDALAALRQGQRQTRPTRRIRFPSFGKPRSPLPESRQLPPGRNDPPPEPTDDADEEE